MSYLQWQITNQKRMFNFQFQDKYGTFNINCHSGTALSVSPVEALSKVLSSRPDLTRSGLNSITVTNLF